MNTMSDDSSYHSHSHDEDCDDMHEAAEACNDSSHSSSGKRKIVSNACEFCKKRKIKCDGSFPCFQCTKRKINCEFHPRAAKRGPKSSHKRSKISEQELNELKNSNSQLKIDLEVQKRLVEYLQQQLQQSGTSIPVDPTSSRLTGAAVKPRFNADSEIYLSSRMNAMKAAITNFQHAIALFMDHYKFHGNSEFALQMWNYLLESTPEQLNSRFQDESLEQLSTLYEHCVVFMHGVRWMSYNDIAEHFLATAENLYRILFLEREAQKRSDLAQQLSHALLFTSYYYKSIGRHEAHKLMMQDASTIISSMESYVDRYTAFVTYIGELLNSPGEPLKMEHCLRKINVLMTKSPVPSEKMIFFFNTAFVFATLAGAISGEIGPTLLREVKQRLDDSEMIMEKNQAVLTSNTELLKCYKIWIYGLRAVLLSHLGMEQDMQRYAQSLSTYLNQIQNINLKLLLTRDLESKLNAINFEAIAKNNRARLPLVTLVRSVQAMIGNVKEPAAGMQALLNDEVCAAASEDCAQMAASINNPYLIFEDFESYNNGAFFT